MSDIVDSEQRSRIMSRIRGKNTKPELVIRRNLHAHGFRYRLHDSSLPGKPDIVLPKWNAVILINGCFWHGHDCHLFRWPTTRQDFWYSKIQRTKIKDLEAQKMLMRSGWRVLVIWECSLKGRTRWPLDHVIAQTIGWLTEENESKEIKGGLDGAV